MSDQQGENKEIPLNPVWPPHPVVWAGVVPGWQQIFAGSCPPGGKPNVQLLIHAERNMIGIGYVRMNGFQPQVIRSIITINEYLTMPDHSRAWLEDCGLARDMRFKPEWKAKR